MTPPEGEDNLLGPIEDVQLPVDDPTLYRGPSIDLRFACKSGARGKPTSGLESLSCSLQARGQWLLSFTGDRKFRIDKGLSVPCIAHYCRV